MKEVIGIILLILICLTPLLYISSQEMMQPFLYKELAFAEAHMDEPHIFPVDKTTELGIQFSGQEYRPATSTILIVLSKILGVPPKAMRFWPIGGIFAVIALFALSRRIFNSYLIASLFAIFIAFGYGRAPNSYNIGVSAWSFPFYFLFILLYYRVLNEKPDQNNLKYIALILFIFITSSLFYYRVGAWMVAFSILLTLILSLHKRRTGNWNKKKDRVLLIPPAIFTISFTIFLIVNGMVSILSEYVGSRGLISGDISLFISRLLTILIGSDVGSLEPYIYITSNRAFYLLNYSLYGAILVPLGIYILIDIKRVVTNRKIESLDKLTILKLTLFFTPIILMIANLPFGTVGQLLGHATYTLPIVLVMYFNRDIKFRRIIIKAPILLLVLMISLQVANFALYHTDRGLGYYPISRYEEIKPSAEWFFESPRSDRIISDFHTFSIYQHESMSRKEALPLNILNSDRYAMIVNRAEFNNLREITDYVIIDTKSADHEKAVLGTEWKFYEPLSIHYSGIESNIHLDKVYTDDCVWIFKTYR